MTQPEPPYVPTRKEREYARHHEDILTAAETLFAEKGYHATTMQMIAEAAEFSVGYLYKHFPGKEDMYRELVSYHLGRMNQMMAEVEELTLPPLEELYRTLEAICAHFNHHRNFMRIFHEGVVGDFCELAESKERHREDMVKLLGDALAAGQLKPCDPALVAAALQGAIKELFHELAMSDQERPFDEMPDLVFSLLVDPLRK
jgi:AcrR family transcriptional regulator|nr:TetR/AcrR family transcriptional regulator [Candidatus Krumholzibacteria bacterium]